MTGYVLRFEELGKADTALAGGKGANLGELVRAGLPVPPGFVVTAQAYLASMDEGGVRSELRDVGARILAASDQPDELAQEGERLQELVRKAGVAQQVAQAVLAAYHTFGTHISVAVRSSATQEDTAETSFAGMNETFTNVMGDADLLQRLIDCWASLYGQRVLAYRAARGIVDEPAIAVVVQKMIDSERSGVMFTADPSSGATDRLVIEAAFGLGEVVVGGQVEPDTYVADKDGPRLIEVRVGRKMHKIVRGPDGRDQRVELAAPEALTRVLSDDEVVALASLGLRVEAHYGAPQDVEWAMAKGETWLVQSRPITTLSGEQSLATGAVLLSGLPASPGSASGRVRLLTSPKEGRRLATGEVLVAPMTNPDWVPTIRRAAAVVTDGGGMTCHAAIVSRELGVPCVVGTRTATQSLRDGELVTVDGAAGKVLEGAAASSATAAIRTAAAPVSHGAADAALATRLYVNLAIADQAEAVAALPVDGVGLLRAEFLVTDALGGVPVRCWPRDASAISSTP